MGEIIVGIDFGGPSRASAQRRKILAVAARRTGRANYAISAEGLNQRLLQHPPGWTAQELGDSIVVSTPRVSVIGADFPFSVPAALLALPSFARLANQKGAFATWTAFNKAIAAALPLTCPVDYAPFALWRDKAFWLKRGCDVGSGAQPPLKHHFQVLFNMTLLGNGFLARLERSGLFDVVPFQSRGRARVIEVYPGHMMRMLAVRDYKRAPRKAIDAAAGHLRRAGITVEIDPLIRAVCETWDTGRSGTHDYDAADAFVATSLAILHREGRARETVPAGASHRHLEGAIWSI
jgi:hypothetical protein